MAAIYKAPVLPAPREPSWKQLSDKLREKCSTQIRSDDRTFSYKVVHLFDGSRKAHTFCPVSAKCLHMSEVLSGITTFGTNLSNTLYISSFAPSTVDSQFCFGHINIPENDWDYKKQKHFHITLYTEVNTRTLKEKARLNCYAEKQKYISGQNKDVEFWTIQEDQRQATTVPATFNACFSTFKQHFARFLTEEFR